MGYTVYGDLIITYPKPYSIYLRGTIGSRAYLTDRGLLLGARAQRFGFSTW